MSNKRETVAGTLLVAIVVCLVCSALVAGAAVALRPAQQANALLDKQRNILTIAGIGEAEMTASQVRSIFGERIEARLVDLETGSYSDAQDPLTFDHVASAKVPTLSDSVASADDIASIKRRERYATVYVVETDGQLDTMILPVRGYGLWSTLYGFIALKGDLNTVTGFGFYEHGETPGLGGEVDNPRWKALWPGKQVFNANGQVALDIVKGNVDPNSPAAKHQIDGLAGSTLTSNGVERLVQFWLGDNGFGQFISNLRKGEA